MLDLQNGLLTLLREFDAICRKHDIVYYLEGGSLLGAVRHKGFLPWDDDVDLCLTRDNWQKLLSVIDSELQPNRELYCYERFPNYLRDTVKYTNLDTTVIFPNHILDGNACGQHIDVFILDPAPSDPAEQEEYKKYACVYSELMMPVYVMCEDIVNYLDEYKKYQKISEQKGKQYALELLREKLFTIEDNDDCRSYCIRWGNRHLFVDKEFFGEPVYLDFEGGSFPAPEYYYRFLRAEFGDTWMFIPNATNQEDHNTYDNYNIPCADFIQDYSPFIDYEEAEKNYIARKAAMINLLVSNISMKEHRARTYKTIAEVTNRSLIEKLPQKIRDMFKAKCYNEIAEYYEPYYAAQFLPQLSGKYVSLNVPHDVLYTAAAAKLFTGQYWDCEKLIKRGAGTTALPDDLSELINVVTDIRAMNLAKEEKRYSDAMVLRDRWISKYPDILDFMLLSVEYDLMNGRDANQLESEIKKYLNIFPDNDRLLKLAGDVSLKLGDDTAADEYYTACARTTRNGIVLLDLPEKYRLIATNPDGDSNEASPDAEETQH